MPKAVTRVPINTSPKVDELNSDIEDSLEISDHTDEDDLSKHIPKPKFSLVIDRTPTQI